MTVNDNICTPCRDEGVPQPAGPLYFCQRCQMYACADCITYCRQGDHYREEE